MIWKQNIGVFVSVMKNAILEATIIGLQKDGLKFSIDTIASKLKISKKTVYKFFPCKEDLAVAVYDKFYDETNKRIDALTDDKAVDSFAELLNLYYQSYCMIRNDVFNKFVLNDVVKKIALQKHNEIKDKFKGTLQTDGIDTAMFIIDGVLEKLNGQPLTAQITSRLEQLIW